MANVEQARRTLKKKKPVLQVAHADHAEELPRLKRVRGQLDGIERMILDGR